MTLFYIVVFHDDGSHFLPYEPCHILTRALSQWRLLPADTSPYKIADWMFHVFNADLDGLQTCRGYGGGAIDLLLACLYRMLRLRRLSVGKVVAMTALGGR